MKESFASPKKFRNLYYSEILALSVLLYAGKNPVFSEKLRKIFADLSVYAKIDIKGKLEQAEKMEIPVPENEEVALSSAWTLMTMLKGNYTPGAISAGNMLANWVIQNPKEEPKILVVGFVVVAIPGLTAGKFKRKRKATFVVRRDILKEGDKLDLAERVSKAGHRMLLKAYEASGNNMQKLEPETGDWFFGGQETAFYGAGPEEFAEIEKNLHKLNIIYGLSEDEKGVAVLAISPSVDDKYPEIHRSLDTLG